MPRRNGERANEEPRRRRLRVIRTGREIHLSSETIASHEAVLTVISIIGVALGFIYARHVRFAPEFSLLGIDEHRSMFASVYVAIGDPHEHETRTY
jgi:hypothetical protein